jgi:hypothetical protein
MLMRIQEEGWTCTARPGRDPGKSSREPLI